MTLSIRPLRPGDEAAAIGLARRFHAESAYAHLPLAVAKVDQVIRAALDDPARFAIVAADGDELVGYLMAIIHEHYFSYALTCSDLGFYILPAHRQPFLARKMLELLEHWAFHVKQAGDINLGISSGVADEGVERFYRRCGYSRGFSGLIKPR